jgi:hypothetical protein
MRNKMMIERTLAIAKRYQKWLKDALQEIETIKNLPQRQKTNDNIEAELVTATNTIRVCIACIDHYSLEETFNHLYPLMADQRKPIESFTWKEKDDVIKTAKEHAEFPEPEQLDKLEALMNANPRGLELCGRL